MHTIDSLIHYIGVHTSWIGYTYLGIAVKMAIPLIINHSTHRFMMQLYTSVAQTVGVRQTSVSREIARAVDDMWYNGGGKRLEHLLGRPLYDKPMPRDVIVYLAVIILRREDGNIRDETRMIDA